MLFGKSRKDKVGLRDREKRLVSLGAGTAAPESTRTHCNERLNNLVPGTLTIGLGLHKARKSLTLIRLEHMNRYRHHQASQQRHGQSLLQAHTTQKQPH